MARSIRQSLPMLVLAAVLTFPLAPHAAAAGVEPTYFEVPRGGHPHDVAAAPGPGGVVYYTAQMTGKLGILSQRPARWRRSRWVRIRRRMA
jgi:virginiamycin B lyase